MGRISTSLAVSLAVAVAALLALAVSASADTLVLKDGGTLDGSIQKVDGGYDVVAADGAKTFVPDAKVAAFRLGGGGGSAAPSTKPADGADASKVLDPGLASLRRSVDNLDDLGIIIAKYERFVEQNKANATVADAARQDLARYAGYRDGGYVKFNGQWVPSGERSAALRETFAAASEARLQIKDGDTAAAKATIDRMLAADAGDVSALYLRGVMAQADGDVPLARDSFEKVRRQLPDHAPTLVNLAAISIKFNQQPRAMTFLSDAMKAAPANREVLDAVAEALAMLDDASAKSRQATLARRSFDQQDAILQRQMAQRNLYRWGSKWVGKEEYDRLKQLDADIQQKVRDIQARQQALRADAARIDRQIAENAAYMRQLDQSRNYADKDGKLVQGPLPPAYFDAQRRGSELVRERQASEAQAASLDGEVARERSRFPTPPYDGAVKPVGEDGVPVTLPPEPGRPGEPAATGPAAADEEEMPDAATRPATRPE